MQTVYISIFKGCSFSSYHAAHLSPQVIGKITIFIKENTSQHEEHKVEGQKMQLVTVGVQLFNEGMMISWI